VAIWIVKAAISNTPRTVKTLFRIFASIERALLKDNRTQGEKFFAPPADEIRTLRGLPTGVSLNQTAIARIVTRHTTGAIGNGAPHVFKIAYSTMNSVVRK
jgi:hypothetical protein